MPKAIKKAIVFSLTILLFAPLFAQKKEEAKKVEEKPAAKSQAADSAIKITGEFTAEEKAVINAFYKEQIKKKKSPPGLAKKEKLPPGWQNKLVKGAVMPKEIFNEAETIPKSLADKLPPAPKGVITVAIEGKAVRVVLATLTIVDFYDISTKKK